jgi:hypothetical protein
MNTHPICDISGVGERGRKADESDIVAGLLRNISHSTDDYFDYRSSLLS